MKKTVLFIGILFGLAGYCAAASVQTITVAGTSATINPASQTTVNLTLALTTSGSPPSNLESVNLLLETANGNAKYFGVKFGAGSASFPTANNPAASTFDTASSSHTGFTDSDPAVDLGANVGGQAVVSNASGVTGLTIDTLTFTLLSTPPNGTYTFSATLNYATDDNGTYIEGSDGTPHGITNATSFSITIIPEPATYSLLAFSALGCGVLRRKRCHG